MEQMSYDKAYARLEEIAQKMESGDVALDEVGKYLKEASSLVEFCKKELKGYKTDFESLLD